MGFWTYVIAWKYKEDDFDISAWSAVDPAINT
jgi:hypothetical protein